MNFRASDISNEQYKFFLKIRFCIPLLLIG